MFERFDLSGVARSDAAHPSWWFGPAGAAAAWASPDARDLASRSTAAGDRPTVVCPDLRGFGRVPRSRPTLPIIAGSSKRAKARVLRGAHA